MLAEGGTGMGHMECIGRSDSPWGPFEGDPNNPLLTARGHADNPLQCAGHADLCDAPDGSWWIVFLAARPKGGKSLLGRETCMAPLIWTQDGWPQLTRRLP